MWARGRRSILVSCPRLVDGLRITEGRMPADHWSVHGCHQEPCRSLATSNGDVQTIDETMDGVLALLQSTPSSLLQNVPMRKLTVDLDVKLSRDRQANRATKTNMCMRLREYYSEEYTPLSVSIWICMIMNPQQSPPQQAAAYQQKNFVWGPRAGIINL